MKLNDIKARCIEEGNCWMWQGPIGKTGYPITKLKGHQAPALVRRLVVELVGRPPAPRQPVIATCGDRRCCNPAHLELSSPSEVGKAAAKKGAFSSLTRRAKISAGVRASGTKLTEQQAEEIRASDKPLREISRQYGINRSGVRRIKTGETWADYRNPFAGLGAR
ncbi:hypothetical protein [Hydrogenophaga sp.]|uniref:hypothetical protein n=1 Tax=Hydrogenophaga sp. TaxID=1904254 RepID=UPI003F72988D